MLENLTETSTRSIPGQKSVAGEMGNQSRATKYISERLGRAVQEVETPVDSIFSICRETENTRMLADQVSNAASDLAKEVSEFAKNMLLGIDATYRQK